MTYVISYRGIGSVSCNKVVRKLALCIIESDRRSKVLCVCGSYKGAENDGFEEEGHICDCKTLITNMVDLIL